MKKILLASVILLTSAFSNEVTEVQDLFSHPVTHPVTKITIEKGGVKKVLKLKDENVIILDDKIKIYKATPENKKKIENLLFW